MTSYDDMYKREVMSNPNDRINNPLDVYFVYEDQKDKKRVYKQLSQKMKDIIDKRNAARSAKEKADAEADAERKRKEAEEAARLAKEKADADADAERKKKEAEEAARLAKEKADADADAERKRKEAEDAARLAKEKEDAERKRKEAEEEAERKKREEAEEEAERKKREEAERLAKEKGKGVSTSEVISEQNNPEEGNKPTLSNEQLKQATDIKDIFKKIKENLQKTPYVKESDIVISPINQKEISAGFINKNGNTNKKLVESILKFFSDLSIKFDNNALKTMDKAYENKTDNLLFSKDLNLIPDYIIERFYGYADEGRGANPTLQTKMLDFKKHFVENFKFERKTFPLLTKLYEKAEDKTDFFKTNLKKKINENPDPNDINNYNLLTEIKKLQLIFVDNILFYFISIIDYCLPFNPSLGTRQKSTLKKGGKKNTFRKTFRKRVNKTFRKSIAKHRKKKTFKKSIAKYKTRRMKKNK